MAGRLVKYNRGHHPHLFGGVVNGSRMALYHELQQSLEATLSPEELESYRAWATRMQGKFRMATSQHRSGELPLTEEEYFQSCQTYHMWADGYMLEEVADYQRENDIETAQEDDVKVNLRAHEKDWAIHYGIGEGHGLRGYLRKTVSAGLRPLVVDWNPEALEYGSATVCEALELDPTMAIVEEIVVCAEAKRIANGYEPPPRRRRIQKAARILEHMAPVNAAEMCYGMGRSLIDPKNRVVLIHTPQKGNELVSRGKSRPHADEFLRYHTQRGAGRPIRISNFSELTLQTGTQVRRITATTYRSS